MQAYHICVALLLLPLVCTWNLANPIVFFASKLHAFWAEVGEGGGEGGEHEVLVHWGLADTEAVVGKLFHYHIPRQAFKGQGLAYKVTEAGFSTLPAWLYFNETSSTFSGVPSIRDQKTFLIEITAYRKDNSRDSQSSSVSMRSSSASTTFLIQVRQFTSSLPYPVSSLDDIGTRLSDGTAREVAYMHKSSPCSEGEPEVELTLLLDKVFSDLSPEQKVKLIHDTAYFVSKSFDVFTLSEEKNASTDPFFNHRYVLIAGRGSVKAESSSQGSSLSWMLFCGDFEESADIAQVMEHNIETGRLDKVLGEIPLKGWYVSQNQAPGLYKRAKRAIQGTATPTMSSAMPTQISSLPTTILSSMQTPVSSVESSSLFVSPSSEFSTIQPTTSLPVGSQTSMLSSFETVSPTDTFTIMPSSSAPTESQTASMLDTASVIQSSSVTDISPSSSFDIQPSQTVSDMSSLPVDSSSVSLFPSSEIITTTSGTVVISPSFEISPSVSIDSSSLITEPLSTILESSSMVSVPNTVPFTSSQGVTETVVIPSTDFISDFSTQVPASSADVSSIVPSSPVIVPTTVLPTFTTPKDEVTTEDVTDAAITTERPDTSEAPTTDGPTTEGLTTEGPTIEVPTTPAPSTEGPTTDGPTTAEPTTEGPTTESITTKGPTTEGPTTQPPSTEGPTTEGPTTADLTTESPTTEGPTTAGKTTESPTTQAPSTEGPTTAGLTTEGPTTEGPTTAGPTTEGPTTAGLTTEGPTTAGPTTEGPNTAGLTTEVPTTEGPTTEGPTTAGLTTEGPTTAGLTTEGPTTEGSTTAGLTTEGPTTAGLTTEGPTTEGPTTEGPTTAGRTTEGPTTAGPTTEGPTTAGLTTEGPTTAALTTEGPTTAGLTTEGPTTEGPTTEGPTTGALTSEGPTTQAATTKGLTTERVTTEGLTTERVTTEGPTTDQMLTTPKPNSPPTLENPIDGITTQLGIYFTYLVPEDTFKDAEDGNTRNLELSLFTIEGQNLTADSFVQFNATSQVIYALSLEKDVTDDAAEFYLQAKDSQGLTARDALVVRISTVHNDDISHSFRSTFNIEFSEFTSRTSNIIDLVSRVSRYYGDSPTAGYLSVTDVKNGSVDFQWTNATISKAFCDNETILELYSLLETDQGPVKIINPAYKRAMNPEFPVSYVSMQWLGVCVIEPMTTEPPFVGPTDDSVFPLWLAIFLPILIIILIILIVILICCLVRRNRHQRAGQWMPDDEKPIFGYNRKPVFMENELEMQDSSTVPRKPVIMSDDADNAQPYNYANTGFDPPPGTSRRRPPPEYRSRPPSRHSRDSVDGDESDSSPPPEYYRDPVHNRPPPTYKLPPPYLGYPSASDI